MQIAPNHILIIEDDIDYGISLSELLRIKGQKITLANTAEEGLELFKRGNFDVSLIDIKLPDKNGVQCYLEMLQHDPDAKAIMMTGHHNLALIEKAVEYGALCVLSKPFPPRALFRLLDRRNSPGTKRTVLLAEDDPDLSESIREYLTYHGYNIIVAYTGEDAVKRALEDDIDIIVLDLRLPIMDGLAVYRELEMYNKKIPTIISTAYANEEHQQIDALLANNHMLTLSKPYDPGNLLKAIEQLQYN